MRAVLFADRQDAGRQLAAALGRLKGEDLLVLALPRGGVPVAEPVARALDAPLDVVFVRKIASPRQPEYALGALVDGASPILVWNEEALALCGLEKADLAGEVAGELAEIERRRALYRDGAPPEPIAGRTIVVIDDGVATGATVRAALQAIAGQGPRRIVLAVPVAAPDTLAALRAQADEVVCLAAPTPFYAVGAHYKDFAQTSDAEVVEALRAAAARGPD